MLIINLVFSLLKKIYLKQTLKAYSVHQYISTSVQLLQFQKAYSGLQDFRTSGQLKKKLIQDIAHSDNSQNLNQSFLEFTLIVSFTISTLTLWHGLSQFNNLYCPSGSPSQTGRAIHE